MAGGKPARFTQPLSHAKRLARRYSGVTGVDFGYIYKAGKRTQNTGIRFHVAQKRPLDKLDPSERLPDSLQDFECDVMEGIYELHSAGTPAPLTPLVPGASIGNLPRRSTGSLGLIVLDQQTGSRCLLSNWHVLAAAQDSAAGEEIIHPGSANLGISDPANKVATLLRWTSLSQGYDAAVARLTGNSTALNFDSNSGKTIFGMAEPRLGMKLVKTGLSSGFTHAVVDGMDGSYPIDYSAFGDTTRWMDGIHLVPDPGAHDDEITLDGDSGAIWYELASGHAVALNFAGEDGIGPLAEYALAQPIPKILSLLNIRIEEVQQMPVSFAAQIRPLFRAIDIEHMQPFGVLLNDYPYMSDTQQDHQNARNVYAYLTGQRQPRMPIGGPYWTASQLNLFQQWMDDGLLP